MTEELKECSLVNESAYNKSDNKEDVNNDNDVITVNDNKDAKKQSFNNMVFDSKKKSEKISKIKEKLIVNLSPKKKAVSKIYHHQRKTIYDNSSIISTTPDFNLSYLDCLNRKNYLGFKKRRIVHVDFDFSYASKKNQEDVLIKFEIATSKEDYNLLFKEIQKLVN